MASTRLHAIGAGMGGALGAGMGGVLGEALGAGMGGVLGGALGAGMGGVLGAGMGGVLGARIATAPTSGSGPSVLKPEQLVKAAPHLASAHSKHAAAVRSAMHSVRQLVAPQYA